MLKKERKKEKNCEQLSQLRAQTQTPNRKHNGQCLNIRYTRFETAALAPAPLRAIVPHTSAASRARRTGLGFVSLVPIGQASLACTLCSLLNLGLWKNTGKIR